MTRDEIYAKIVEVMEEALGVDEDEVTPEARLVSDLGAESLDFLDISFQLERAFGFKIEQGELFPDGVAQDPTYVQDGKLTDVGLSALREKLPHMSFDALEGDPQVSKVPDMFTVDSIVTFVERKLGAPASS